jgi:hypothetical protein
MKIKLYLTLFIGLVMLQGSAIENNNIGDIKSIKFIGVLKDAKGDELGKIYIEDFTYIKFFKADIFKKLFIKTTKNGVTKTLYTIDNCVFRNPKGIDITCSNKNFNGYKIEFIKNDSIQLFAIGNKQTGAGASDPALIEWNCKKELFEIDQAP